MFEWFDPSPIEPFNVAPRGGLGVRAPRGGPSRAARTQRREEPPERGRSGRVRRRAHGGRRREGPRPLPRARRPRRQSRLVERFDRRGIEPFELYTSEFGQNSVTIQYIWLENSRGSGFSTSSNIIVKFRQNLIKF